MGREVDRGRGYLHDSAENQVYLFACACYVLNCLLFSLMRLGGVAGPEDTRLTGQDALLFEKQH